MPKTCVLSLYYFNKPKKGPLSDLLDQDGKDSNWDSFSTCYFFCWGNINHGWAWDPAWKYKRAQRQNFGALDLLRSESERETPSATLETLTLAKFQGQHCLGSDPQNQDVIAKKRSRLEDPHLKPVRGIHKHWNIWFDSSPDLEPIVVATSKILSFETKECWCRVKGESPCLRAILSCPVVERRVSAPALSSHKESGF